MSDYTTHLDGTSSVNREQTENNCGVVYRGSGNLFIAKQTSKTVPRAYSGVRGNVVGFSAGSGIRMRRYLRECKPEYRHMVTLTYPFAYPTNGTETKNHLRRFLQEVQRWDARTKPEASARHSAFWFLEFQERGAPHYHIFFNRAPDKSWVSQRWYDIVGSDDIRHLYAGTRTERLTQGRSGTISYASKYAAKLVQKVAPPGFENVGRFWGVYGDRITLSADTFVSRSNQRRPEVVRDTKRLMDHVKKCVSEGIADVIKRDEGVLIVVIHDERQMMKARRLISALACNYAVHHDYFEDAEVCYGEIYDGEHMSYKAEEA